MGEKILSIIAICTIVLCPYAMAEEYSGLDGSPNNIIRIYPESGTLEKLDYFTITAGDNNEFGAFVYMPSLYSVNEDGSLGMEVSACELMDTSARGKKELQFKVLNPPNDSGKYAFIIKKNSFSLLSSRNDEDNITSMPSENVENNCIYSEESDITFKNFPINLESDTLRILHISNSYGNDLLYYIKELLEAANVDVKNVLVERLMYSNGSFKSWNDVFKDENANPYWYYRMAGDLDINITGSEGGKYDGSKYRLILENPWDLIILNQVSTDAPYPEYWNLNEKEGGLLELLSVIRNYHPEVPIGFLLIHSFADYYKGNTEHWTTTQRWEKIRDGVEWLKSAYDIDFIIPYGTAIENLRITEYNNGYELTRDGTHLSNGLAKYTAGCCYFETVFSSRYKKSVWGNSFRVLGKDLKNEYEVEVDDAAAEIAQKAAFLARHNIYEIRNPYMVDLTDYKYGDLLNEDEYRIEYYVDCLESVKSMSDQPQGKTYCVYGSTGLLLSNTMSEEEWEKLPEGLYVKNGNKIYKPK